MLVDEVHFLPFCSFFLLTVSCGRFLGLFFGVQEAVFQLVLKLLHLLEFSLEVDLVRGIAE